MEYRYEIYEIVKNLPEFTLKEGKKDEWEQIKDNNRDDDYSWAAVVFAKDVMSTCEALKKAECALSPAEMFRISESICDFTGITGFQEGAVRSIMKSVWAFSDEFMAKE